MKYSSDRLLKELQTLPTSEQNGTRACFRKLRMQSLIFSLNLIVRDGFYLGHVDFGKLCSREISCGVLLLEGDTLSRGRPQTLATVKVRTFKQIARFRLLKQTILPLKLVPNCAVIQLTGNLILFEEVFDYCYERAHNTLVIYYTQVRILIQTHVQGGSDQLSQERAGAQWLR